MTTKKDNKKTIYIIVLIIFLLLDAVGIWILMRNKIVKDEALDVYSQIAESVNSVTVSEYMGGDGSVSGNAPAIGADNPVL